MLSIFILMLKRIIFYHKQALFFVITVNSDNERSTTPV